ncbi:sugar ABC transporter substrate-binding protein [Alkalihalobacillus alcalophilus ATCC 27647 = CGMCC 1.3604]|uniref:Sugar ABC transporter substrate-binding protein n=1 Tax=Alkalihalobacillus alcalophilus ATCC 27647 = CGMCC 1.3604 TaxID=1218173 RepID=A0A094WG71_ALKAL|nr:sugar ABC transporter substrate-binding protein [Alkalihalobacillus alcalophilus]KGA96729.1 sugar ABC transporter substrate-binding protein [Alkalihalobacillus alcalophilus ATCC 27647 = CGMCC 1.3604]MED1561755.1 sugar ABC transporter substrate-binding protein [Alkalihalobacillus alcalophilus]THG91905.1 sugar ABC transporter substrate-binding protein [Alkalihalobacillus alcalophilus ATCC 27647 = CGMCC 1.3604]
MRKKIKIVLLCSIFIILSYYTYTSAEKAFRTDWQLPQSISQDENQLRLVLITYDMETPFWDNVGNGALKKAQDAGVSLEVWGSYGNNKEDFLKKFEIAIHSKVDGIIIQGLDTEEFNHLSKFKASFYGIPIVMVANDVPMTESLRKTYVGSDQFMAGKMLAEQLLDDMGTEGNVILMYDSQLEYYQEQRLLGIDDILHNYPNIQLIHAKTNDTREQVITTTQEILNQVPDADAFIVLNANMLGGMYQEIGRRSQMEAYFIYSFDDGPESMYLLQNGMLDGMIQQSPEMMGEMSVELMLEWLNGETVPLDIDGYFTDIFNLKATDVQ